MDALRSHVVRLIHVPKSLPEVQNLTLVFRCEDQLLSTAGPVSGKCRNNAAYACAECGEK